MEHLLIQPYKKGKLDPVTDLGYYPTRFFNKQIMDPDSDKPLNDIVFTTPDDGKFFVRRNFIMQYIPNFKPLLDNSVFNESEPKTFSFRYLKKKGLEAALEWLYTGSVNISYDNFKDLAHCAKLFSLKSLLSKLNGWIDIHPECEPWRKKYLPESAHYSPMSCCSSPTKESTLSVPRVKK